MITAKLNLIRIKTFKNSKRRNRVLILKRNRARSLILFLIQKISSNWIKVLASNILSSEINHRNLLYQQMFQQFILERHSKRQMIKSIAQLNKHYSKIKRQLQAVEILKLMLGHKKNRLVVDHLVLLNLITLQLHQLLLKVFRAKT